MSDLISTLHPAVRVKASALLASALSEGIPVKIYSALRTPAEQAQLYAKGRTQAGVECVHAGQARPIGTCSTHPLGLTVTKLLIGYHNAGLAFDVAFVRGKKLSWSGDWEKIGAMGEKLGLTWGGRWRMKDLPHFEDRSLCSPANLRAFVAKLFPA